MVSLAQEKTISKNIRYNTYGNILSEQTNEHGH